MKTMTSVEAQNRFGLLLDTTQREPVVVTKDNRPVGIMLSMKDAKNTLIAEMFLEKEEGYDEWRSTKIQKTLSGVKDGSVGTVEHEEVMKKVEQLFNN